MPVHSAELFPLPPTWFATSHPSSPRTGHACTVPGPTLRLDTLPDELLLQLASWLAGRDVLALSETSRALHAPLAAGPLACMRLAQRISRVVTPSGLAPVVAGIMARPASERAVLAPLLVARRNQLHPSLLRTVQPLLDTLLSSLPEARLAAPRGMQPCGHLPLPDWRTLAATRPADQQAPTLAALLNAHVAGSVVATHAEWTALLSHATEVAAHMATHHTMHCGRLLTALGNALEHSPPGWDDGAWHGQRRALWERLLAVSAGLPDHGLRPLFGSLARYPCHELRRGPDPLSQLGTAVPAWQAMLDTLMPRMANPEDATDLLCALLAAVLEDRGAPQPQRHTEVVRILVQRQPALPEAQRSRLLLAALEHWNAFSPATAGPLWAATLLASASLQPCWQPPLLASLASMITETLETYPVAPHIETREPAPHWNAVLGRTAALPADLRLVPATALAHAAAEIDDIEHCVSSLLRLASGLSPSDCAALLTAMLEHDYVHAFPRQWADLVNAVVALPAAVRDGPLGAVASRLATGYYTMREMSDDAVGEALRPGDSQLGTWPDTIDDALDLAAAALRLLPGRAAGAVLHDLATLDFPYTAAICWTLREIRRFACADPACKAVIVTRACAALVQTCHPSQLNAVMPEAWSAMLSLPADQRGSALHFLLDLLRRHHALHAWEGSAAQALATLPDCDRPAADGRKRRSPGS